MLQKLKKNLKLTYEKDGKTVKIGSWTGKDGSFYRSKVVTYGKGLTKETNGIKKLEEKLNEKFDEKLVIKRAFKSVSATTRRTETTDPASR